MIAWNYVDAALVASDGHRQRFKPLSRRVILRRDSFEGYVAGYKYCVHIAQVGNLGGGVGDEFIPEVKLRVFVSMTERIFEMNVRYMQKQQFALHYFTNMPVTGLFKGKGRFAPDKI